MKNFVYMPWIEAHGDVLLREVFDPDPELSLIPLRFTPKGDDGARRALFHFARSHPKTYSRLFEKRLLAITQPIHGLVLTLDWPAPMRIATQIAQHHGIPVVLLPHEGVYMDEAKFYRDPFSGVNCSIADHFLAWGHLQKNIMVSRGFAAEKVSIISSPKLQNAAHYTPQLTRADYCARLGLNPDRKIIMFCAQTLDNIASRKPGRRKQAEAVLHLFEVCAEAGHQLIVRLPPVQHERILQTCLAEWLPDQQLLYVKPGQGGIETDPREANWHADCVASISSTMLLEKGLMNGPSLGFDYIDETSPFILRGQLPAVKNKAELASLLPQLLAKQTRSFPPSGWANLEHDFSNGDFDGQDAMSDIARIFKTYDTPITLHDRPTHFQQGFFFADRARAIHSAIFKTLINLRIPYRNKLTRALFPPLP